MNRLLWMYHKSNRNCIASHFIPPSLLLEYHVITSFEYLNGGFAYILFVNKYWGIPEITLPYAVWFVSKISFGLKVFYIIKQQITVFLLSSISLGFGLLLVEIEHQLLAFPEMPEQMLKDSENQFYRCISTCCGPWNSVLTYIHSF